jgi:putative protein kinase ArgK-like GTPase of G3E family
MPIELRPPILTSTATSGQGIVELAETLDRMHAERAESGVLAQRRRENLERRVRRLVDGALRHDIWTKLGLAESLTRSVHADGPHSAHALAAGILETYRNRRHTESE